MPLTLPKYKKETKKEREEREELERLEREKTKKGRSFMYGPETAARVGAFEEKEAKKSAGLSAIAGIQTGMEEAVSPEAERARGSLASITDIQRQKQELRELGRGEETGALPSVRLERPLAETTALARTTPGMVLQEGREDIFARGLSEQPEVSAFLGEQEKIAGKEKAEELRKGAGQLAEKYRDVSDLHADVLNLLANTGNEEELKETIKTLLTDLERREVATTATGRGIEMQELRGSQALERTKLMAQAQKQKGVAGLGLKKQERLEKLQEGKDSFNDMFAIYDEIGKLVAPGGTAMGLGREGLAFLKRVANVDDPIIALRNYGGILKNQAARVLGGEKGVMTDRDIKRVKGLEYKATDTHGERAVKRKGFQLLGDASLSPQQIRDEMSDLLVSIYGKDISVGKKVGEFTIEEEEEY